MEGHQRRTSATRRSHDEAGRHQRRHPVPARPGSSRQPSARPHRRRHEGPIPCVPTDGGDTGEVRRPRMRGPTIWRARGPSTPPAKGRRAEPSTACPRPADEAWRNKVTHVSSRNVGVKTKRPKGDRLTQSHRCRGCTVADRFSSAGPHRKPERTEPWDAPASRNGCPKFTRGVATEAPAPPGRHVAQMPAPGPAPTRPGTAHQRAQPQV
ncbi:hypothetical protein Trydic_g9921 [Trypoxylus dichotomus]